MDRKEVARVLEEIAAMLELKGENPFKIRAYENGSRAILGFSGDLGEAARTGELRKIKGIGAGLSSNIETLVTTGSLPYWEELRAAFPPGLAECLRIPGLGARKVKQLHDALGIESLDALENACRDGRLSSVSGFGSKSVDRILKGIGFVRSGAGRHRYSAAIARAEQILLALESTEGVARAAIAGDLRRRCETVRGADFVVETEDPAKVAAAIPRLPGVAGAEEPEGAVRVMRLVDGMLGRFRFASPEEFGAVLLDATGSAAHVEQIASRAAGAKTRSNAEGSARKGSGRVPEDSLETEAGVYAALGLPYIEPELREGAGEIEAADARALPRLIRREDLQGVLHVHTTESDGRDSLEDMLAASQEAGYRWVGITDHSQTAAYAGGLTPERVLAQREAIRGIRPRFPGLRVFHGTEADILADGSIDFGDEFLEGFDLVVASVHSRFGLSRDEQTRRLIRAVRNPLVSVLGHPTGRLLLSRDPISVDVDAVLDAAAEAGCAIEINGSPARLDLDWRHCRGAVARGIPIAIDPDAHSTRELEYVSYGLGIARKGWVTAEATLNAKSAREMEAWLEKRRGKKLPKH